MRQDVYREFWRHRETREVWAVTLTVGGRVVAACGPLRPSQAHALLLPYLPWSEAEGARVERARHLFVPVGHRPYAAA
jgi:hypothetical protein